jgi:cytochrome c oxidase accessory protein FixG
MCPYARFQSAMFDRNTLIIAYDPMRGEPRGPRKKSTLASVLERARGLLPLGVANDYVMRNAAHPSVATRQAHAQGTITFAGAGVEVAPLPKFAPDELGDCIDCTMCVQVCPTGIDIRNGLQYECIACGACIDACDEVMDRMGYPRGLIRYATQNSIEGKPSRVLRPRVFVYGLALAALVAGWAWGVGHRSPLLLEVLRDRNALYREAGAGIENGYTLKLVNKTDAAQEYRIEVRADALPQLRMLEAATVEVAAGSVASLPLTLQAPAGTRGRHDIRFVVRSADGSAERSAPSSFFGPLQ